MTMTRAASLLTILVVAALGYGCALGMTARKYRPAREPNGVIMHIDTAQGALTGELIEVRQTGIVLLSGGKLRLLPYKEVLSSKVEQTSSKYSISKGTAPKAAVQRQLRLLSRFPQGLTPELMQQLLS